MIEKSKNILLLAQQSIDHTAQVANKLNTCIDNTFVKIVEILSKCKGRLVLSGLGKSAIVAQKVTATLNSTGTPSIYMHAADALHGDLGIVCKDDILILFSKSGDTDEIVVLAEYASQNEITSIAITHNKKSLLANKANLSIILPKISESDPNNLAPTTSIVCQIMIGDAIAICLQQLKEFTPSDFGKYHPSGLLGKLTNLTVNEICVKNEKPIVYKNTPLKKVIFEISEKRLGATIVLDENNKICGIITDGDLRRMMEKYDDFLNVKACQVMSKNPITIYPSMNLGDALKVLESKNITQLVVASGNDYCGIIHLHDLIKLSL